MSRGWKSREPLGQQMSASVAEFLEHGGKIQTIAQGVTADLRVAVAQEKSVLGGKAKARSGHRLKKTTWERAKDRGLV